MLEMNAFPLVSVITPTYNHEKYIGPCIESLLSQTYSNWEQIIIDDGSNDATQSVVEQYKDKRIHYIHQENQGIEALAHTYNRALGESNGELIGILEGDDLWPPNKLELLVPALQKPNVVLAYGIPCEIDIDGLVSSRMPRQVRKKLSLPDRILFNDPVGAATGFMLRADGHELIAPSTVIIRRDALQSIRGFQYIPNLCTTDFPTFVRLSRQGYFHFQREIMGLRRRHPDSAVFCHLSEMSGALPNLLHAVLDEFRATLSQRESKDIEDSWKASGCVRYFTQGRLDLLREDWRSARFHFPRAINPAVPRVAVAAAIGWIFSWFRWNIEPLFKLSGRSQLKFPSQNKNAEIPRR